MIRRGTAARSQKQEERKHDKGYDEAGGTEEHYIHLGLLLGRPLLYLNPLK